MPAGTMPTQVAIRAHTEPGDAVLFAQNARQSLPGHRLGGMRARCEPVRIFKFMSNAGLAKIRRP